MLFFLFFWQLKCSKFKFVFLQINPIENFRIKKVDQKKYQKSPPYYHLEFIIRYDNKKIGAFNQSNQKKIFRFFLQIIKDKKNHRIQWPKKKENNFSSSTPCNSAARIFGSQKKIFMSHRSPKKIGPTHRKNPTLNSCFKNKTKKLKKIYYFLFNCCIL